MNRNMIFFRFVLNVIINLFPLSCIKVFLYRTLLGYKIAYNVKLGFMSILVAKEVEIGEHAKIGVFSLIMDCKQVRILPRSKLYRFVLIHGLECFEIGEGSLIGVGSTLYGRFSDRKQLQVTHGGQFVLGENSVIGGKHYFDLSGNITIGRNVVMGGLGSQVFTHGYDCYRNFSYGHVDIADDCYIGTSVLILAGVSIGRETVVAAGSVVCKSCLEKGVYAGNPAKRVKDDPRSITKFVKK